MGTRADFYIGRGEKAEWLGSIAWDGYPAGIADAILTATNETDYKAALDTFFSGRNDVTLPEHGWPWPWDDSRTTDYAYAFDENKVYASGFGRTWFVATDDEPDTNVKDAIFPDMSARKNVTFGKRSGITIVGLTPSGKIGIINED